MTETSLADLNIIGKGIPKADARLKATGSARFAGDVCPEKRAPLCGKILRSHHAHAKILSIDASQAAAFDGVYAVVTGADVSPVRIGRFLRDRTVLAQDKVRCVGEPVAAVAAIDEQTAEAALSLIEVQYEPLPAVFATADSLAPDAPIIHEELASYEDPAPTRRSGNVRHMTGVEYGDVDAAFAAADVVVEGTFTTQAVHQGFIEPKACVADLDQHGKVTIWPSNKGPFLNRNQISQALGLPLSKVRIITPAVGGDFGGKGAPTIEPICALLAQKARRPVKIAFNTKDELATNFVRHPSTTRLRVAASKNGKLLGVEGEVTFDCGAYCDGVFGMAQAAANLQGAYAVPAVRVRGISIFTNNPPAGHVRAPGAPQTFYAIESLMDELAHKLNLDPFALRRMNALREGDTAPGGRAKMGGQGLRETIESVAQYVGEHRGERQPNEGWGVACGGWHMGAAGEANSSKCIVKLNEDGSAVVFTGLSDNGAGQHIAVAQVVAEILGLTPEEITVVGGDTELTPFDNGPGGSRGTVRVAHSAAFAAEDARLQILALAAAKLEARPEDLTIGQRQVYVKGSPEKAIALAAITAAAMSSPRGAIVGTGGAQREQWLAKAKAYTAAEEASFCTHSAKVAVDTETGHTTVLDYVAAQDAGTVLNPLNAVGQIQGAVVQGLGQALFEELVVCDGQVVNPSYTEYLMPAADIAPSVKAFFVEQPSILGPFGARGIGETSITPVAAVIANAIYDAVGVRISDLPITPQKVLSALQKKSSSG